MKRHLTWRHTFAACAFANFFQAIGTTFPILLIPLRITCGLTYTQYGILVSLNFCTQVISDIAFSKPVEKHGFRPFAIAAPLVASLGLALYALAPRIFPHNPFIGFCLAVIIFAASTGLQELLLSPIVDALPMKDSKRAKNMSLLHSFFAWGQIFIILATTGMLRLWGVDGWPRIIFIWAAISPISAILFSMVPLESRVSKEKMLPMRNLLRQKIFWLGIAAIACGGAAEVTMGQWASAFIERGLLLSKSTGDLLGVCGFSLMLALGRTAYGIWGEKIDIHAVMLTGSLGATVLYLLAALSPSPIVGLVACALTGLCTSLLWPGSMSVVSRKLPLAGASLFALMSAAGDVGASASAFAVGFVADHAALSFPSLLSFFNLTTEQFGLRCGLLLAAIFPLCCWGINFVLHKEARNPQINS
ncbi:MAG: MFS transporter [Ruthenibacterium sp.]